MRIDISVPDAWLKPLKKLADKRGVSLSRLLYESAARLLPPEDRKKLPVARGRGRPPKEKTPAKKPRKS